MKRLTILLAVALLSACALPQTTVHSGSSQPGLIVKGAPQGAMLYVDSLQIGPATHYDGNPNVLAVLEGTHKVEIREGSNIVYSEKVFVSSGETHTVLVVGASR